MYVYERTLPHNQIAAYTFTGETNDLCDRLLDKNFGAQTKPYLTRVINSTLRINWLKLTYNYALMQR